MKPGPHIPDLMLPFGALGGVVGWIFTSALQNPVFRGDPASSRVMAAVGGAVTASLVGAHLSRWTDAQIGDPSPSITWAQWAHLVVPLFACSALTGALVGEMVRDWSHGVQLGLLCALCATPLCAAVLRATLRAARARHGSLVADADRREVWSVLVLTATFATLADLLTGLAWKALGTPGPWISIAVVLGGVAATAVILRRDLAARRTLAAESRDLRAREREHASPGQIPTLDLGLGDEQQARHVRGGSAYRHHDREVALVIGNLDEARSALDGAVRRRAASLCFTVLVAAAHTVALGPLYSIEYSEAVCDHHALSGCAAAARLLEARDPADERIGPLYARACDRRQLTPCDALVTWFSANPDLAHQASAVSALTDTCAVGHGPSCSRLADLAEQKGNLEGARSFRARACSRGHAPSCP